MPMKDLAKAQVEAQAAAESYRSALIEAYNQRFKADAQLKAAQAADEHVENMRIACEEAHARLEPLIEQAQQRSMLTRPM